MDTIDCLKALCKMNEKTVQTVMKQVLEVYYPKDSIKETENYIMAEGNIPVGLIAHMDVIHKTPAISFFYDSKEDVLWSPEGLGADDRAGLAAIFSILEKGEFNVLPHIILTQGEEMGGLGALALIRQYPQCPFKDIKFFIELDRQGEKDCVFYNCANTDFINFISSFGFDLSYGTFTDISIICPTWKIAGVNLSVGYINEHTKGEYLVCRNLKSTISKVCNIINYVTDTNNDIPVYNYISGGSFTQSYPYYSQDFSVLCGGCNKSYDYWDLVDVKKDKKSEAVLLCFECFSKANNIELCKNCNNWYFSRKNKKTICVDCEEKQNNGKQKRA